MAMAKIPKFKTEEEEREYWDQHSPLEHLDELTEQDTIQVKERPPKIQISLRIRPELKDGIERLAVGRGIPYQTLIHSWIMERFYAETGGAAVPPVSDARFIAWVEQLVESRVAAALTKREQPAPSARAPRATAGNAPSGKTTPARGAAPARAARTPRGSGKTRR